MSSYKHICARRNLRSSTAPGWSVVYFFLHINLKHVFSNARRIVRAFPNGIAVLIFFFYYFFFPIEQTWTTTWSREKSGKLSDERHVGVSVVVRVYHVVGEQDLRVVAHVRTVVVVYTHGNREEKCTQ